MDDMSAMEMANDATARYLRPTRCSCTVAACVPPNEPNEVTSTSSEDRGSERFGTHLIRLRLVTEVKLAEWG